MFNLSNFSFYNPQPPEKVSKVKRSRNIVIGERCFALNKSRSKFASIGLAYDCGFEPCIKLEGNNQRLIFTNDEWEQFLSYQGVVTNYLFYDVSADGIKDGNLSINFKQFSKNKVIEISMGEDSIYLGSESVCTLWELLPLLKYKLEMVKKQEFPEYFKILQKGLQRMPGDILINALDILQPHKNPNSESMSLMLELVYAYPEVLKTAIDDDDETS